MLQTREMDGKCGEIIWSGHEGEKLTKLTWKTQKKSNIDKQNKQQTKKKASNLSVA